MAPETVDPIDWPLLPLLSWQCCLSPFCTVKAPPDKCDSSRRESILVNVYTAVCSTQSHGRCGYSGYYDCVIIGTCAAVLLVQHKIFLNYIIFFYKSIFLKYVGMYLRFNTLISFFPQSFGYHNFYVYNLILC